MNSVISPMGHVFRDVLRNRDLRRVEMAFVGFNMAEYGTWIAILVFAYKSGGSTMAGIVGAIQLLPSTLFAPVVSTLGDRYPRRHLLVAGYLLQAIAMGFTAIALISGAPLLITYATATVTATGITATRPVQGALLPSLADTPRQLTGANVVAGWVEGASIFAGPFVTGLLLAVSSPGVVFGVMAVLLFVSTVLTIGIRVDPAPARGTDEPGTVSDLVEGIRVLGRNAEARSVVTLMGGNFVLVGALDILLVVLALRLLHLGGSGAGFLNSAFGVGGIVGAVALSAFSGRRAGTPLIAGALAWAFSMVLIGALTGVVPALILIGVAGAARPLVDISGRTLLQRAVPDQTLSRVFGLIEGLSMGMQGLGMILTPVLLAFLGDRGVFIAAGALLPLLLVWTGRRVRAITIPSVPESLITMLRALPVFRPLPLFTLEQLASKLLSLDVPAGSAIIRQGESGNTFYILTAGSVNVSVDGTFIRSLLPGEVFGEIALLRNIPRTATVTAATDVSLYVLAREDFLEAVTGHPQSRSAADSLAQGRFEIPVAPPI